MKSERPLPMMLPSCSGTSRANALSMLTFSPVLAVSLAWIFAGLGGDGFQSGPVSGLELLEFQLLLRQAFSSSSFLKCASASAKVQLFALVLDGGLSMSRLAA